MDEIEIEELEMGPPLARRNAYLVPTTPRLDENPAAIYLASLAKGSRRTMQQALDKIAQLLGFEDLVQCPWSSLRFQHTTAIRTLIMEEYSAATANKMLSALRGTLKHAWRLGQIDAETYQRAVDLQAVHGDKPDAAAGRALTQRELHALMRACASDQSAMGVRDAAIMALAYTAGLRRAEFVALDLADFDQVTNTLIVRGKRNKTRTVPIEGGTLTALFDWLTVRGEAPGPLFVRIWKGGKLSGKRMTTQAIYHIQTERAKEAGVKHFSPHDLRRTFAGDLLDAGADLATVQKLMGHANANTTAGYDRRGERAKREAVKKLNVPYQRGTLPLRDEQD